MQVNANGISFNCQIDGPVGAPWLIFSNSLMTDLSMWDDQVAELKNSYRILRYDQRGHGSTEAPPGTYSFDVLTADVIALMDALQIKRAHFAGISMGGMTALFLAQRHPDRFDRVIPCDCGPASTPASAQQWKERIDIAAGKGMESLVEPTVNRWFPPEFVATRAPVLDKVRRMIRATPVAGFSGCAAALSDYDLRPGLSKINRPVLCIVGTKDATLPGMEQTHAAVPGSALAKLEGAGHLSNLEQPAAFSRAIRDFLKPASAA
jgi:3-oxoadipate enol-lactonase